MPPHGSPFLQPCFHTTITVTEADKQFRIAHVLLDSGASSNIITRAAVAKMSLGTITFEEPQVFSTGGGPMSTKEIASLTVTIGGITRRLQAYVQEAEDKDIHLIIGTPGLAIFRVGMDFAYGAAEQMRATVRELGGEPRVIEEDFPGTPLTIDELKEGKNELEQHTDMLVKAFLASVAPGANLR